MARRDQYASEFFSAAHTTAAAATTEGGAAAAEAAWRKTGIGSRRNWASAREAATSPATLEGGTAAAADSTARERSVRDCGAAAAATPGAPRARRCRSYGKSNRKDSCRHNINLNLLFHHPSPVDVSRKSYLRDHAKIEAGKAQSWASDVKEPKSNS